jgi:hypothetical protein
MKYLDKTGLSLVWNKITEKLNLKVDKVDGKQLSTEDYTTEDKTKLGNITSANDAKVTILQGSTTKGSFTLNQSTDTTITIDDVVTDSTVTENSTNPVQSGAVYKIIKDNEEVTAGALNVLNSSIGNKVNKETGKVLSSNDYTTAEKTKLSGIAEGANKTVIDSELSATSTNPVQSKVLYKTIKDNEEVTAGALYSLNERLDNILSLEITSNGTTLTLQEWIDKIGDINTALINIVGE